MTETLSIVSFILQSWQANIYWFPSFFASFIFVTTCKFSKMVIRYFYPDPIPHLHSAVAARLPGLR